MMDNKVKFFTCAIVVDWKIFYRYLGLLDFLWGCSLLAVGISLQFQYIRLDQFYQPYRPELGYLSTALIAVGSFTLLIAIIFFFLPTVLRKVYLYIRGTLTSTQFMVIIYTLLILLSFQAINQPNLGIISDQFGGYNQSQSKVLQTFLQGKYIEILIVINICLFLSLWGFYFNCLFRKSLQIPVVEITPMETQNRIQTTKPYGPKIVPQTSQQIQDEYGQRSEQNAERINLEHQNSIVLMRNNKFQEEKLENIIPTYQTIATTNQIVSRKQLEQKQMLSNRQIPHEQLYKF